MSPLNLVLMVAVVGLTACGEARAPATVPTTPASTTDAAAAETAGATAAAVKFPACVQPSNQGTLGPEEIAPGCYTVCREGGSGAHPAEAGMQTGPHLTMGDGVEIGKVKQLTLVNIRPNNAGARPSSMRPDEQWPMLGDTPKTKVEGARSFMHTLNGENVSVPHTIEITKIQAAQNPSAERGCTKNNVIEIKFCTDMVFVENEATVTKFQCGRPPEEDEDSGDQGHVHAEN